MSCMRLNTCLSMSYHGLLNPFKDPWIAAHSLEVFIVHWWSDSMLWTGSEYTRVLSAPHAEIESTKIRRRWGPCSGSSPTSPSVMIGTVEDISNNMVEICCSTTTCILWLPVVRFLGHINHLTVNLEHTIWKMAHFIPVNQHYTVSVLKASLIPYEKKENLRKYIYILSFKVFLSYVYRMSLKCADKLWEWAPRTKTRKCVHINMGLQIVSFRVTAQQI
jgi:hypothetical protein